YKNEKLKIAPPRRYHRPSRWIRELCQQFPQGITDQVIQNDMPHLEPQQRALAINKLLSLGQLDLLRNSSGLLYRLKDSQTASKMKGSDNQEKLVYQIIEDAGNKGELCLPPSRRYRGSEPPRCSVRRNLDCTAA
uniref:Uncharacterized protein n=1 Tax=Oryzias latipes TaxID=8090 RepID=A0A3P9MQI0_ORYLA